MLWYFPIESVASRYTHQLCNAWMPDAFDAVNLEWQSISGMTTKSDIETGVVLDATGRGIFSCTQIAEFLRRMDAGQVKDGDTLYFQDYWTPGMEAIPYAAHLFGIQLRIFSTLFAQSVDEYDFTYPMRDWIRLIELGYDRFHTGIFVASTIHRKQLRDAGWRSPIHVVGLPIDSSEIQGRMYDTARFNQVVYCSRLDHEKNPDYMLEVAEAFLLEYPDWDWVVTTSRSKLVSNDPTVPGKVRRLADHQPRFKVLVGCSKDEYYTVLKQSRIQFNSAFQDYVSFTLLEACLAGCDIAYPNYRSFPECVPADRLYQAWSISSALDVLGLAIDNPQTHVEIPLRCDLGRIRTAKALAPGASFGESNIWQELIND